MKRALVVALVAATFACGPSARERALSYTLAGLNGARSGFVVFDEVAQTHIVDQATSLESGEAALKAYRAQREPVMQAFMIAYSALAAASVDMSVANIAEAAARAKDLYEAVKAFKDALGAPSPAAERGTP